MSDRNRARLANEQLFGIKVGQQQSRNEQRTTPPNSFTSPEGSGSSSSQPTQSGGSFMAPPYGLPTPTSSVHKERRAQLVLSDLGDGRAEVMFSPTPLKPSSPPRIPNMITPIRTPLSRKIAARSASSPALLSTAGSNASGSILTDTTNIRSSLSLTTPTNGSSASNLNVLRSLKRPHSFVSPNRKHQHTEQQSTKKHRGTPTSTPAFHDIGRGKENIPPGLPLFSTPVTYKPANQVSEERLRSAGDSYGREIRRIQSENLGHNWSSPPRSTPIRPPSVEEELQSPAVLSRQMVAADKTVVGVVAKGQKKMSAEECALSLVSLAHGA